MAKPIKKDKFDGKIQGYLRPYELKKFIKFRQSEGYTESMAVRRMVLKIIDMKEKGTLTNW